ncbi:phospholipase (plasmid) [Lichenicola cladoniae]|uniref:Phospholipase D n=1 Tax=Lichenicola cladoniae TaxID=1484109 RepID=A0A6M8HXE2_9PROT|nr:phospholipase D-like domain-containing protein [Lichenicola cladoniae]NPD68978.1 phospholipase [Acetobacteraceae bacterium]QKE92877.1 phospholipase [Lichenicola cladoniae]
MTDGPILREDDTCWRREKAGRLAVIIDAENYFTHVQQAILQARHSILLIGWDFDARIKLNRNPGDAVSIDPLGRLLSHVVRHRPDLHVHVLRWDIGFLRLPFRGSTPFFLLNLLASRRLHFRIDSHHPADGCCHQKILVVDDAIAFCGGIDISDNRWDTRAHRDHDPRRVSSRGTPYRPWHDATTAMDGGAARALGELGRARWHVATGQHVTPPPPGIDLWPKDLVPQFCGVSVAIARTEPAFAGDPGVREVEALTLAAIAAARRTIYVENQYFAAHRIAAALQARLVEADGPEVVIVAPRRADGWLSEQVMGSARAILLKILQDADRNGRLRFYTPVTDEGHDIYVHAKVLIVDDRLLRIGSSNFNNRSMGLDTECDIAIEAAPDGDEAMRREILRTRDGLLAEHLGVAESVLQEALAAAGGSLVATLDRLVRPTGRSLRPFVSPPLGAVERTLAETHLLDPDHPESMDEAFTHTRRVLRPALPYALSAASLTLATILFFGRIRRRITSRR